MPSNKSALLRYKIIDRRIRNKYKSFPSIEDLRQACEDELFNSTGERVSRSTIEKDIRAMREDEVLGYLAPIKFDKIKGGYFYENSEYSISALPLNEEELRAIRFASQTLHQFRETPIFRDFQSAIQKIFSKVAFGTDAKKSKLDEYVQFELEPVLGQEENLPLVLQAVLECKPLSFIYQRYVANGSREHLIHPLLLKEYRSRWYVVAFVPSQGEVLLYGLDRMKDITIKKGKFQRPGDFNADLYFRYSIGITTFNDGKPELVVLSFTPMQGNYIRSKPMHKSQKVLKDDDAEFRIEMNVQITYELINAILGYAGEVTVHKPKSLVKSIRNSLENTLRKYPVSTRRK
ncbi:MAG: WYL domain-containing protein [Bacteroidetes bacterium]|nr:WYL domain-containing protein [Bacteroidota bacterium]